MFRHWRRFQIGLALFVLGALCILAGAKWYPLLQVPGLLLITVGALVAGIGYWGILTYRLKQAFKK